MHGGTTDLKLIGEWVKTHPGESYAQVLVQYLDTNGDGKITTADKLPENRIYLVNPLNPNDKFEDPDNDGLKTYEEYKNNTNPLLWDTDGDMLPDGWEIKYTKKNLDPTRPDTNADDIPDDEDGDGNYDVVEEIINGIDDDHDGRIDEEYDTNDANEDPDLDGVFYYLYVKQADNSWKYEQFYHPYTNYYEYYWGWSIDDDDFHEITTNPNEADSDGDRIPDGWEIWVSDYPVDKFNKTIYDDDDGLSKGWEDLFNGSMGLFPLDFTPYFLTEAGEASSYKGGGMDSTRYNTDGTENDAGDPDPNADGIVDDGEEDPDGDGANNSIEYKYHTDPTDPGSNPNAAGIPIHGGTRGSQDEARSEEAIDQPDLINYEPFRYDPESYAASDTPEKTNDIKSMDVSINRYIADIKLRKF
jgi:hypothetical protein